MSDLILSYSDTHLRSMGSFPPFNQIVSSGLTKELRNIIAGFKFVANQILEHRPRVVVCCGDIYHNTEYISSMTLHGASIALDCIKQACDEVGCRHIMIPGNHDILAQDSGFIVSSITNLSGYGDLVMEKNLLDIDGFRIGLVPYNKQAEIAHVELLDYQSQSDLMFTHLDFAGGKYDSGKESLSTISPHFDVPVISGDLHVPHDTGSVCYVGSLVQHKFHRYDIKKVGGVLLYDMNEKTVLRIPNNFSKHYVKMNYDEHKDELKSFNPDSVVLQVFSEQSREDIEKDFEGYDWFYIKKFKEFTEGESTPVDMQLESPKESLQEFIKNDNPEALDQYERVMNKLKE